MEHIKEFDKFRINDRINDLIGEKINPEDYFDIDSISQEEIDSITNDMRAFLQLKSFDSYSDYQKRESVTEDINKTLSINKLKTELKKLGFKLWQIKSEICSNENRVAILYVDISKNTEVIKEEMESFGWEYVDISDEFIIHKTRCRIMTFDPSFPKEISKSVFSSKYIYHWTPKERLSSILSNGIEPRSENLFLKYKPKVYLMKESVTKEEASILGWQLYKLNTKLLDGQYSIVRINVDKIPRTTIFYGDTRCECGITTKSLIPSEAIEEFGKIEYIDKKNYHHEMISVIVKDDTMVDFLKNK